MSVDTKLRYTEIDNLKLDPKNPRIGRRNVEKGLSQEKLLEVMEDFTLDELGVSFVESDYWPQEPVIAVEERLPGRDSSKHLIVVEGNRRIAALKLLQKAVKREEVSKEWRELVKESKDRDRVKSILEAVPYLLISSRKDVQAYLAFRHVTGIKQWEPAEKAEFIANMVDEGHSYVEVKRMIGSNTQSVRQNYVTYRIFLQMEEADGIDIDRVEKKFSVLYLAIGKEGVRTYLDIKLQKEPTEQKEPVPDNKLDQLKNFALWWFGYKDNDPLITDSRQADKFGVILQNQKAVRYLETTKEPRFDTAYRIAGGEESDVVTQLDESCYCLERALGTVHLFKDSPQVKESAKRLTKDVAELLNTFPEFKKHICD